MDSLISSFDVTSLGGGVKKLDGTICVYISEVSSPTRLWIQLVDSNELDKMTAEFGEFYENQGEGFSVKPDQVAIGMKVAAFACGQWDRAEVISVSPSKELVKLFFMDFGTTGLVPLRLCRLLIEHFAMMRRQSIRGGLYGISPRGNTRLWDLTITSEFILSIKDKTHQIKIMKHHEQEDFYEFLLFDDDGKTINEKFVSLELADEVAVTNQPPLCLSYPSFNMLEKLVIYPTYSERSWVLQRFKINLNHFEEVYIPIVTNKSDFEKILKDVLSCDESKQVKEIFMKLHGN